MFLYSVISDFYLRRAEIFFSTINTAEKSLPKTGRPGYFTRSEKSGGSPRNQNHFGKKSRPMLVTMNTQMTMAKPYGKMSRNFSLKAPKMGSAQKG